MTIITPPERINTAITTRLIPKLHWPPAPIKNKSGDSPCNYSAYGHLPVSGITSFYKRRYLSEADTDQNTSAGKDPLYEATEREEQLPFKQRNGRQMEEEMFEAGIMCFHDVLAALKER